MTSSVPPNRPASSDTALKPNPLQPPTEQQQLSAIQRQLAKNVEKPLVPANPYTGQQAASPRRSKVQAYLLAAIILATVTTGVIFRSSITMPEQLLTRLAELRQSLTATINNISRSSTVATDHPLIAKQATKTEPVPLVSDAPLLSTQSADELLAIQLSQAKVLADNLIAQPKLLGPLVELYRRILQQQPEQEGAKAGLLQTRQQALELLAYRIESEQYATAQQLADQLAEYFPELTGNATYRLLLKQINLTGQTHTEEKHRSPPLALAPTTPVDQSLQTEQPNPPQPSIDTVVVESAAKVDQLPSTAGDLKTVFIRFNYQGFTTDTTIVNIEWQSLNKPTPIATVPIIIAGPRGSKNQQIHSTLDGYEGQQYQLDFILNGQLITSHQFSLASDD